MNRPLWPLAEGFDVALFGVMGAAVLPVEPQLAAGYLLAAVLFALIDNVEAERAVFMLQHEDRKARAARARAQAAIAAGRMSPNDYRREQA